MKKTLRMNAFKGCLITKKEFYEKQKTSNEHYNIRGFFFRKTQKKSGKMTKKHYIKNTSIEHRKEFGQFFTEEVVADFMMQWVLGGNTKELYDPAFGLGAFKPKQKNIDFSASEADETIYNYYKNAHKDSCFNIYLEDYLLSWGNKHANIICNPPYNRFQNNKKRKQINSAFNNNGIKLPGNTNVSSLFLIKSLMELKENGRLAYIMPLEFLNSNYGTFVKQMLIDKKHLVSIISLECEKDVFSEVITTVGILLYDSAKQYDKVSFFKINKLSELKNFKEVMPVKKVMIKELKAKDKWQHFLEEKVYFNNNKMVSLEKYGRFCRGIVTGSNDFFTLAPTQVNNLNLQEDDLKSCITKSNQIKDAVFTTKHFKELKQKNSKIFLFSPREPLTKTAKEYIRYGEKTKANQGYVVRNRSKWYKSEEREPANLLIGTFFRNGYKVVLNETWLINLTCYHGFIANDIGKEYLLHLFLYLNSKVGRKITMLVKRRYGDGLYKFEPNDLNGMLVPKIAFLNGLTKKTVIKAVQELKKGNEMPDDVEQFFNKLLVI